MASRMAMMLKTIINSIRVKPRKLRRPVGFRLPGTVCFAIECRSGRGRVCPRNSGLLRIYCIIGILRIGCPVGFPGHGIDGQLRKISRSDQIVEALRGLALIQSVLFDETVQLEQILPEHGFASLNHVLLIQRYCDGHEDHHDADDDHELKKGEAAGSVAERGAESVLLHSGPGVLRPRIVSLQSHVSKLIQGLKPASTHLLGGAKAPLFHLYHSLYFVPSRPSPCDLV